MPRRLPNLCLTLVLLAALIPAAAAARQSPRDRAIAREIRRCTNVERARLGLRTLRPSAALTRAARLHARNMALGRTSFDHDDRFGRGPSKRVAKYTRAFSGVGENLAARYRSAGAACRGWRTSAGHYANWTNTRYTAIGTGSANGPRGRMYVQVFAVAR